MAEGMNFGEAQRFKTPEEEISYLRSQIQEKERALSEQGAKPNIDAVIKEEVKSYAEAPSMLHEEMQMPHFEVGRIILDLAPEDHDGQMDELAAIVREKGVKNAYEILKKIGSPHLEDDFHRYLAEYVKEGYKLSGLKEKGPFYKSLRTTLYEVSMPQNGADGPEKGLKELISGMEQFYAGMLSLGSKSNKGNAYFALEVAMENVGEEFAFYAAVPTDMKLLFEKHVTSIFPNAKVAEKKDDYNIFNPAGASVASYASSNGNPIFPLKTYEEFDQDPLNAILGSFSKIDADGEGAAIQFILNPEGGDAILSKYKEALKKIHKGEDPKKALDISYTLTGEIFKGFREAVFSMSKKKEPEKESKPVDQAMIEGIQAKIASHIFRTNVRIVASSRTEAEAEAILEHIESSFNQFANTKGNKLEWKRVKKGGLKRLLREFTYRTYSDDQFLPLSVRELTSLMHFETAGVKSAPTLKQTKAGSAPAPVGLSSSGILLGVNRHRNIETKIYMSDEDRLRHFYVIGQTGTGKTTFLKNMIVQDIEAGHGVCFIDPHGSDVQDVLASVPKERYEDVIYFDPAYTERPFALNMLEYDQKFPEQKTFVVNELFGIFQKLYGAVPESMGPMFEQYFRNATMLVIEDPESGNTLLDVSRVMANKQFRDLKLSRCKNPIVVQFWKEIAEKAGGEGALQNIVPYITSKFDVFLANDFMRPIIAQERSSFNFREVMDQKKILLVNLSKGRLGDINANLIGLIIVGKILMAALSRVDSFGQDMPNFYLFIDEFQNITTNSISTILSEARKYKLSLTVAHQFLAQLDEKIRDSVFGNVGSIAAMRVGSDDAEFLEKQFEPVFTAHDLMNVDNRNVFLKLLAGGKPVRPFNIEVMPPYKPDISKVEALKQLSYLKFGGNRAEIEAAVMRKYQKEPVSAPAQAQR